MQFLVILFSVAAGFIFGVMTVVTCDDDAFDEIIKYRKELRG